MSFTSILLICYVLFLVIFSLHVLSYIRMHKHLMEDFIDETAIIRSTFNWGIVVAVVVIIFSFIAQV